jgi:4'-phosphopantetheinyl transferase
VPAPELLVRSAAVRPAAALAAALTGDEQSRVARAAPADRDAVASALLLARRAVAQACGVEPGAVRLRRRCGRCGSTDHGVPRAERADGGPVPRVSISRTADLVVVALGRVAVGVDLERVGAGDAQLATVALADGEPPAAGPDGVLRTWVRKEAVLKAAGTGLGVDPQTLRVSDAAGRPLVAATGPAAPPDGTRWWLTDLDLGPGHVAALATALPPGTTPPIDHRVADLARG